MQEQELSSSSSSSFSSFLLLLLLLLSLLHLRSAVAPKSSSSVALALNKPSYSSGTWSHAYTWYAVGVRGRLTCEGIAISWTKRGGQRRPPSHASLGAATRVSSSPSLSSSSSPSRLPITHTHTHTHTNAHTHTMSKEAQYSQRPNKRTKLPKSCLG